MTRPLVSLVVPTRNRPEQLAAALASIAAQHEPAASALQVVVVNDGGLDVAGVTATARASGLWVTAAAHPRRLGLPTARNTGLELARGRYVAFLDDDDELLPGHLADALTHLESGPGAPDATIAACLVTEHRERPSRSGPGAVCWDVPFDPDLLAVTNLLPVHAAVLRHPGHGREAARFDATLPALEDWDFWLRLSHGCGYRFARLPTASVLYHRSSVASSMLNDVVAGAAAAARFSGLVERVWRRWPARGPRSARFRAYTATMYWQLLAALATGRVPNPHYYLHSVQAIAAAWVDPSAEAALTEQLTAIVTGAPDDGPRAA